MAAIELRPCGSCQVQPGQLHVPGCSVERCARCGGQDIGCNCIYELNDMDPDLLETEHPSIYSKGPTEEMYRPLDAEVERLGGRLPWTGEFPGKEDCRRLGFWCRPTTGYQTTRCTADHPEAREDLNRLASCAVWDPRLRRWELP